MGHHDLRVVLVTAAAITCAVAWGTASAQQKHPIEINGEGAKGRYVQQLAIDVDDVAGHQVRVLEIQETYPAGKEPLIDGERVVETWARGFSNYIAGVGPAWGYTTWSTDKGNKVFVEYAGTSETRTTETGSRRGTYNGASRIVGGTGRFATLRGVLVDSIEFDTDPKAGYSRSSSRGEYWFGP